MNQMLIREYKRLRKDMERTAVDAIAMARSAVFFRNRHGLK